MGLVLLLLAGVGLWWLEQPLDVGAAPVELAIDPGTPPRGVVQALRDAGVKVNATALAAWFRLSGQARHIRAGSYEIGTDCSPRCLLRILVRGEENLRSLTLLEGWTLRQIRAALAQAEGLRPDSQALSDEALSLALGRSDGVLEGHLFPDTYSYARNSSDLALLKRAQAAMDRHLQQAWAQRQADLPLSRPDEALILASLIEKETGKAADRAEIAGVFINRLRRGMLLQTDPTVIYGLGSRFDGKLRRKDLMTDSPWNTYTRPGLPPPPIAMPGRAALLAAVQPARTPALYFVARGDGSSQFSSSLDEHHQAVNRYIRRSAPAERSHERTPD